MSEKTTTRAVERLLRNGRRMVMLEESEYERLRRKADEAEPLMPKQLPSGNYPAAEALAVIQARNILRARRKLGLSQAELARRAGLHPETLNRIEQGRNKASVPTVAKIDRALKEADPPKKSCVKLRRMQNFFGLWFASNSNMKTKVLRVRVSERLYSALRRHAQATAIPGVAAAVRSLAADSLGDPTLAEVNPVGRPWPKKRKQPAAV